MPSSGAEYRAAPSSRPGRHTYRPYRLPRHADRAVARAPGRHRHRRPCERADRRCAARIRRPRPARPVRRDRSSRAQPRADRAPDPHHDGTRPDRPGRRAGVCSLQSGPHTRSTWPDGANPTRLRVALDCALRDGLVSEDLLHRRIATLRTQRSVRHPEPCSRSSRAGRSSRARTVGSSGSSCGSTAAAATSPAEHPTGPRARR